MLRAVLVVVLLASVAGADEPIVIDDYSFHWKLVESRDLKVGIWKNADRTSLSIHSGGINGFSLSGQEAEALGAELQNADKMFDKMKQANVDATETNTVGELAVTYAYRVSGGFFIVAEREGTIFTKVQMSRADAKSAIPHLLKASKLLAAVDERVKP